MKIGALLPHLEVFGGVRRYIEIGNIFVQKGYSFTIYHTNGSQPAWLKCLANTKPQEEIMREYNDIVLTSTYSLIPLLKKAKARIRIFYCLLEHENNREVCKDRDLTLMGNSTGICDMIRRRYGRECIEAIGGINPEIFYPKESSRKQNRDINILAFGRIYKRRKRVNKVIKAVELLYRTYPQVKLLLFDTPVGNGGRDIRTMVQTKVPVSFYIGLPQEKMAELYSQADVFVSAEKRAGWSNPCAEAMACKVPVVCTRSGTKDFAIDGETALVLRYAHPFLIARKIKKLIEDKNLRERIARNGYEKIQEFTWENLVNKLEGKFRSLLGSGVETEIQLHLGINEGREQN